MGILFQTYLLTTQTYLKLTIHFIKDVEVFEKLHLIRIYWLFEVNPHFKF
ncbi:hypothetical protein LEP1GSC049_2241 [Leptospira kirschneri serovar Cynopteri str. 3522 CT]|nr:hypothetical protein LEP1GSC044_2369 [Leptospira kirschneri serovar Grippotyphosa str. RM52]EKR09965.1 hypothetical protein LEP1GSC122_3141 [Leptospira kirschneri serovar Valbuzzi str. 200702274]EMK01115.1 hypothetical protein LEP1GSC176_1406 [Leptospira kirschneri str. MMD1493]EPG50896.1 hypothetical protein LEP1GSC049_2241 [Leptospira kirschneri serovar Cynopteri str. 3522 CT]